MEAENGDNAKQSIEQRLAEAIVEGREIKTRDGKEVRFYTTDGGGNYPIHGAVRFSESEPWSVRSWTVEGQYEKGGRSGLDLVVPPRTIEIDTWLNVYENGSMFRYETKEAANIGASSSRFACINIKRPVTEGEGLQ